MAEKIYAMGGLYEFVLERSRRLIVFCPVVVEGPLSHPFLSSLRAMLIRRCACRGGLWEGLRYTFGFS